MNTLTSILLIIALLAIITGITISLIQSLSARRESKCWQLRPVEFAAQGVPVVLEINTHAGKIQALGDRAHLTGSTLRIYLDRDVTAVFDARKVIGINRLSC